MAWDFGISEHGDLIFTGHRDLAGKSGTDLLEQRMILRLKLHRGEWIFDDDETLGSNLYRLIGMSAADIHGAIEPYVREALRPMDNEIQVVSVSHSHVNTQGELTDTHEPSSTGVVISIVYRVTDTDIASSVGVVQDRQLTISLPLSGGG